MLITESNAEPFLGAVDVLLALYAYNHGDWALSSAYRSVPAFPAVYGGYYAAAGAEFFQSDLLGDAQETSGRSAAAATADGNNTTAATDVWCAKLARQLLTGAQLGWASLGGRDNQDPPMGLYELLMNNHYTYNSSGSSAPGGKSIGRGGTSGELDEAVVFWRDLATARAALGGTFWDGRASRDLDYSVTFDAEVASGAGAGAGAGAAAAAARRREGPLRRRDLRRSAPRAERGPGEATGMAAAAAAAMVVVVVMVVVVAAWRRVLRLRPRQRCRRWPRVRLDHGAVVDDAATAEASRPSL